METKQSNEQDAQDSMEAKDEGALGNFTMMPDILGKIGLTPHQGWLYFHIKQMVHENKRVCRKSVRTLAEESCMSPAMVVKVKNELIKLKLISVKRTMSKLGDREVDEITIKNVWPRNAQYFADLECSSNKQVFKKEKQVVAKEEDQDGCSSNKQGVLPNEQGVHVEEHRDSSFRDSSLRDSKRLEKEEKPAAPDGAPPVPEKITFGEFVKLSEIEHKKLLDKCRERYSKTFGVGIEEKFVEMCIEKLDNYIGSLTKKKKLDYMQKDHYRCILGWVSDAIEEKLQKQSGKRNGFQQQPDRVKEIFDSTMQALDQDRKRREAVNAQ